MQGSVYSDAPPYISHPDSIGFREYPLPGILIAALSSAVFIILQAGLDPRGDRISHGPARRPIPGSTRRIPRLRPPRH